MKTPDIGTAAREDRTRIDFSALRAARRQRVFAEMERLGLDACMFGRESNVRYVAGQRRLWTSNTRAYLPSCVVVSATKRVHVMSLSASMEDSPEDLPREDVYGRSFDGATLLGIFAALPGLADARRVGVDGLTVSMRGLIGQVCRDPAIVGAEAMMRTLRRVKLPGEIECIRVATAVAESSLQRAADALRPGITGSDLRAIYLDRMATLGTTTFAQQGSFQIARPGPTPPWSTEKRPFAQGDVVTLSGGALWAGYEGSLARTWWCGEDAPPAASRTLHVRWHNVMDQLVDRCRPGGSGADLAAAYDVAGEARPSVPVAYAVGLGHEGPFLGSGGTSELATDMVIALRGWVTDAEHGYLGEELVRVTDDGPEVLTKMSHGPIARAAGGIP